MFKRKTKPQKHELSSTESWKQQHNAALPQARASGLPVPAVPQPTRAKVQPVREKGDERIKAGRKKEDDARARKKKEKAAEEEKRKKEKKKRDAMVAKLASSSDTTVFEILGAEAAFDAILENQRGFRAYEKTIWESNPKRSKERNALAMLSAKCFLRTQWLLLQYLHWQSEMAGSEKNGHTERPDHRADAEVGPTESSESSAIIGVYGFDKYDPRQILEKLKYEAFFSEPKLLMSEETIKGIFGHDEYTIIKSKSITDLKNDVEQAWTRETQIFMAGTEARLAYPKLLRKLLFLAKLMDLMIAVLEDERHFARQGRKGESKCPYPSAFEIKRQDEAGDSRNEVTIKRKQELANNKREVVRWSNAFFKMKVDKVAADV